MTNEELDRIKLRLDEAEQIIADSPAGALRSAAVAALDVARWMWDELSLLDEEPEVEFAVPPERVEALLKLCSIAEEQYGRMDSKGMLASIPVSIVRDQLGEDPLPPLSSASHGELWAVCHKLPSDYEPWGERSNDERGGDCSTGCKWFHELGGARGGDWGVCFNPDGPRSGLLTFEHQGCTLFEYDPDDDEE